MLQQVRRHVATVVLVAGAVAAAGTGPARPAVAAVTIDAACAGAPAAGFADVPPDHTFADEIACLRGYGITEGTAGGHRFEPGGSTRRWQMVQFLARLAEIAEQQIDGFDLPEPNAVGFTDIGGLDARHRRSINVLARLGVVEGRTAGRFAPYDRVRRDQMASFVNRLQGAVQEAAGGDPAGLTGPRGAFADVDDANVHRRNIDGLAAAGIVEGRRDGRFRPYATVTRGQMAAFVVRLVSLDVRSGLLDNPFRGGAVTGVVSGVVTAVDRRADTYTVDTDDGGSAVVDYDTVADDFVVDGEPATPEAFEADLGVGDRVTVTTR